MSGIALAIAFAYAAWLYAPLLEKAISAYKDMHTPPPTPKTAQPIVLPAAIDAIVNRHGDDWAQELVRGRARELYEDCADWGQVALQLEQESGE